MKISDYPFLKDLNAREINQINGGFSPLWLPLIAYKIAQMLSEKG
ncbi:hypothetical protein [Dyadobacter sediminis]|nr:hypothetical protein [Dyadobacter sediminis]